MVTSDRTAAIAWPQRFIGRWLVATWAPPIGICILPLVVDVGLGIRLPLWISSFVPFAFWLSVSIGEAWALTGIVPRPGQWGTATFFSGLIAMLCLFYGSSPLRVLNVLAIYAGLTLWATTVKLVLGGGAFGFVIGIVPMTLFRSLRSQGPAWIGVCIAAGVVSFGWLEPLDWGLHRSIERFGEGLPLFLFPILFLVTPAMALFMLGWLAYSLLTGLALRFLVDRQARIDGVRMAGTFD